MRYGIVSFSDEAGVHLYPTKIDANKSLVEVSNVTYFDNGESLRYTVISVNTILLLT